MRGALQIPVVIKPKKLPLLSPSLKYSVAAVTKSLIALVFVVLLDSSLFAQAGRLDWTFPQLLADGANVTAIETQSDGKIIVAGKFTT
ncbi:MAG: delta-60 repeat domain-containing protein, partial [Pyrinomonadaceae bacterium]